MRAALRVDCKQTPLGRGERRFHVQTLAITLDGRRMPAWERVGDALLREPAAVPLLDGKARRELFTGQIEPMLHRELHQRGLDTEHGGFSTHLIGWVEVRG